MNKLNLGNKLALIIVACIFPCVFLASFFINYNTKNLLVSETDKFVQVTLQNTYNLIENQLLEIQHHAKVIAASPSLSNELEALNTPGVLTDQLNRVAEIYPQLFYIALINKQKQVVGMNSKDFFGHQLTPMALMGERLDTSSLIPLFHDRLPTMGIPGEDTNFSVLSIHNRAKTQWFAAPVIKQQETLGWVVLSYRFEDSVSETIDQAVKRLQAFGYPVVGGDLVNDQNKLFAGESLASDDYLKQTRSLFLGGQRFSLQYYFDDSRLSQPLRNQTFIVITAVIPMVFLLVSAMLWAINSLVLTRIRRLEKGANVFSSGNFEYRIEDHGDDELTALAKVFNHMGDALAKDKREMELLVDERTAEAEESSQFLSSVLNQAAEAIITIDQKGHILSFNQTAEAIFGYAFEEIKGKNIKRLMPTALAKAHDGYLNSYLKQDHQSLLLSGRELTGVRKSGEEFPIDLSVSEVQSSKGLFFTGLIRDISDKKEAQRKITESQKQLEQVVDSTAVGIWDWHLISGEFKLNRRWAEILGYQLEELEPTSINTWANLAHPEDLKRSNELLEAHWQGDNEHYVCESRMKHKDGHWVWVLDTGQVIEKDEAGTPLRMVGTHLDITERKKAEIELVRLSRIANQTDNAVILTDTKGKVQWVNPSFTRITGYSLEEVEGNTPGSILQGADTSPETIEKMRTAIRDVQPFHVEVLNYRKNGSPYWLDLRCTPLMDEAGEHQGFMALEADVTAQKAAETQLSRQRQLLEQMSQQGRIGAWEVDIETSEIYWSSMTKTIHEVAPDYKPDLETSINFYKEGDSRDRIQEAVKLGIEQGKPWHEELQLVTAAGREIWVIATGNAEFKQGRCVRLFGSFQDVDARIKQRKELAEAKEQAEEAAIAKSSFLASMSHEIRTPMNGVLGMLGLLQKSELTKEQLHHVNLAKSSGESLLTLINDILDFSKVEAGKLDLEVLDFDLRSMLGDFAESLAQRAQEKGLELVLDVSGIHVSMVKGDPGRIRQILTNLVGNAIKFTDQGEVVIRAKMIEKNDQTLSMRCDIEDTGIGIPKDRIAMLFDSFTQVDASTTRKYGGTGLGLAICKQLCELMNGRIDIASDEGKGSCFSFEIELETSDESKAVIPSVVIKGTQILVVDDNATNRAVLKGQLELWGAEVTEAASGSEAMDRLFEQVQNAQKDNFKVAFVDFQMPQMDGAELGAQIQNNKELNDLKLVMMTSISNRGDAQFFADLGFSAYFPKPTTTSDLFNALSVVMADGDALAHAKPLVTHHYLKELTAASQEVSNKTELIDTEALVSGDGVDETTLWPEQVRLLLVEDNYINQAVAQGVLESMGLTCDIAGNGLEAITALRQSPEDSPYTLILMDCQMPEMDGYQATQEIRNGASGARFKDVVIVAMTANAMKGDKEKCLDAGMNDYLSKPIEPEALHSMLSKWILR